MQETDRNTGEYVAFAAVFAGIITAAAGIISAEIGAALAGAILSGLGVAYFGLLQL